MRLMERIRESIKNDKFPQFVKDYVNNYYSNSTGDNNYKNKKEKENQTETPGDQIKAKKEEDENIINNNNKNIPQWVIDALNSVNINVLE
jgi:membrane-associated HD superfamily phosphohydrolase